MEHVCKQGGWKKVNSRPNWKINQRLTSPAPWNKYFCSDSFVLVRRIDAIIPATATAAVPVNIYSFPQDIKEKKEN